MLLSNRQELPISYLAYNFFIPSTGDDSLYIHDSRHFILLVHLFPIIEKTHTQSTSHIYLRLKIFNMTPTPSWLVKIHIARTRN
jgi:hypothetical protein